MPFGKQVYIVTEIGEQNILAELVKLLSRIARQPVLDNLLFCFHIRYLQCYPPDEACLVIDFRLLPVRTCLLVSIL